MAKLKIFKANKENMLKLPKVAGAEERICLSGEMYRAESKELSEKQRYVELIPP